MRIPIAALVAAAFFFTAAATTLTSAYAGSEAENNARIAALQKEIAKLRHENEGLKAREKQIAQLRRENEVLKAKANPMAAYAASMPVKAPMKAPMQAPAQSLTPSGYIEMYAGWNSNEFDSTGIPQQSNDGWLLGGAGRLNWWINHSFSVQLDAQGEGRQIKVDNSFCSFCGDKLSLHEYLVAAHATWRDPQRGGVGIFGAVGDASPGFRFGIGGGEAIGNWNQLTGYLQGGYASTIGRDPAVSIGGLNADLSGWFLRGTARYYPAQNVMLEGTVMGDWNSFDPYAIVSTSYDVRTVLWRAKAEWMANPYLSVFAAYQGSRTDSSPSAGVDQSLTDNRIMGGVRVWINRDNLRNNDLNGAPFDVINPLIPPRLFGFVAIS
jgi:hypothetical protein